ncbi:MAG: response regulator transcription factor [Candidatus Dormiibacterota bacterium]
MTDEGGPIRVLVVDDHPIVREGIKAMLESDPDFEVVGESDRGAAVVDLVTGSHPDIVLLDARLPDIGGPEVCRQLTERCPDVKVIILTVYTDDELVEASLRAGAKGYVVKDVETLTLKESIRLVLRGQSVLSPQVAGRIAHPAREAEVKETITTSLNKRQLAILRLVAEGYSNREVASKVNLSENTIKTHLQTIFAKLGVRNRVEAAMVAAKNNLI